MNAGPAPTELVRLRGEAEWMDGHDHRDHHQRGSERDRAIFSVGLRHHPAPGGDEDGFETPDGKRVNVEDAFKNPEHPFRIAIVCAMWLTGFDVECLATLYIDKP
jgi:type I restriction enzyme R subunit